MYATDKELLHAIRNDDDAALKHLYLTFFTPIESFIMKNGGTKTEAKDNYQEVVHILFENIKTGGFVLTCKVQTYLYSLSRQLWIDKLERENRWKGELIEDESFVDFSSDLEKYFNKKERLEKVINSLDKLGEPGKTILEDFFCNNLSIEDIAKKIGYANVETCQSKKHNCFSELKNEVLKA